MSLHLNDTENCIIRLSLALLGWPAEIKIQRGQILPLWVSCLFCWVTCITCGGGDPLSMCAKQSAQIAQ